jgi:hypothetical protein
MSEDQCRGTTQYGERCRLKAGASGFCHLHNPARTAERENARKVAQEEWEKNWSKGERLREVLEVFKSTCSAKGWHCDTDSMDIHNWHYATISVIRYVSHERVSGLFDITVDDGVRVVLSKTSFYGHGLVELRDAIMDNLGQLPWLESCKKPTQSKGADAFGQVEHLLKRFHVVARQLRHRYSNRETLVISDEHDVQDLLHALLKTAIDDVRPEEFTPSYAGACSRIDFLLKKEKIVVEAKMASPKLTDKAIGEQLIIDIKRYQTHSDSTFAAT